ncbi:hypothetical protein [Streptomyces sannanensis]
MSGHDLPASSLPVAFLVTGVLAWGAGRRRRGTVAIGGGLLAVQGALHLLFGTAQAADSRMSGPRMGGPNMGDMVRGHDAMSVPVSSAGHGTAAMAAVHLLAALVCALWLARGEAAFFRLAHVVGALAFTPLRLLLALVPVPELPRHARQPRIPAVRPHSAVLAHAVSWRGPPPLSSPRATVPGAHV